MSLLDRALTILLETGYRYFQTSGAQHEAAKQARHERSKEEQLLLASIHDINTSGQVIKNHSTSSLEDLHAKVEELEKIDYDMAQIMKHNFQYKARLAQEIAILEEKKPDICSIS